MVRTYGILVTAVTLAVLAAGGGYGQAPNSPVYSLPLVPPLAQSPVSPQAALLPPTAVDESPLPPAGGAPPGVVGVQAAPPYTPPAWGGPPGVLGGYQAGRSYTPPARCAPPGVLGVEAGPPPCALHEDNNGSLLKFDPLLEDLKHAPPGWYAAVEVDLVGPHIENRVSDTLVTTTAGTTNTVHLPMPRRAGRGRRGSNWATGPAREILRS